MGTRLLLEGTDLATLMARVADELGPGARVVRAERVRAGGVAGFFTREHFELTVDVPEAPEAATQRPRASRFAEAAARTGLDDLLDAADSQDAGLPVVSTGSPAFADVLEQVRALVGGDEAAARPAAAPQPVPEPVVLRAAPTESPAEALADRLAALGVPARLLVERPRTLSQALAGIPEAPELDRRPGSVIAVVGAAQDADAVARLLAERLNLDPAAVVHAGTPAARPSVPQPRGKARPRPTGPDEARQWRAGAAKAPHPWVVALAVAPDADERAAGAELLRALGANRSWAVVDARTKAIDARAWMAAVGPFDAVAARGVFDTSEPGTLLDLGVPVAWLDGIPAGPVAWAAVLDGALGGRESWD
ncbi:hypothetical protein [Cellulomonas edaphi]|uniref:Uncharacterized protein n=1 Tax=Cellulomonas edaphi TaxID=3053468 RepID=A0ABT7S4L4_9CELL|nr:hypothetical protein [Cellulomons edaphi]MDM7830564.1 hypothetical protein [Cellulomons edaphi]